MKSSLSQIAIMLLLSNVSSLFAGDGGEPFISPRGFPYPATAPTSYPIVMPPRMIGTVAVFQDPYTGMLFQGNEILPHTPYYPDYDSQDKEPFQEIDQLKEEVRDLRSRVDALKPVFLPAPLVTLHADSPAFIPLSERLPQEEKEKTPAPSVEIPVEKVIEKITITEPITLQEAAPTQAPAPLTSYAQKAKTGTIIPLPIVSNAKKESDPKTSETLFAQKKKNPQKELSAADKKKAEQQKEDDALKRFTAANDKILEKFKKKDFTEKMLTARCLQEQLEKKTDTQETQVTDAKKTTAQKIKPKNKKNASKSASTKKSSAQDTDDDAFLDEQIKANKEALAQKAPELPQEKKPEGLTQEERAQLLKNAKMRAKTKAVFTTVTSFPVAPPVVESDTLHQLTAEEQAHEQLLEFLKWLNFKIIFINEMDSSENQIDRANLLKTFNLEKKPHPKSIVFFEIDLLLRKQHFHFPACEVEEPHHELNCSCHRMVTLCNSILKRKDNYYTSNIQTIDSIFMILAFHMLNGFGIEQDTVTAFAIARQNLKKLTKKENIPKAELILYIEKFGPSYSFAMKMKDTIKFLTRNEMKQKFVVAHSRARVFLRTTQEEGKKAGEPSALYWEAIAYFLGVHWSQKALCTLNEPHSDTNCSCQTMHELLKDDPYEKSKLLILLLAKHERGIRKSKEEIETINAQLAQEDTLLREVRGDLQQ